MRTVLSFIVAGAICFRSVLGAAVEIPGWSHRHRARSVSMPGLKLVKGDVVKHSYLVKMNKSVNCTQHLSWAKELVVKSKASNATSVRVYDANVFHGYSAELDEDAVNQLLASDDVDWVEEDGIMSIQSLQSNATWGLSRLTTTTDAMPNVQNPTGTNFRYIADDHGGEAIDVYTIDTGVRASHVEFGGRAKQVYQIQGLAKTDDNGHGTHVAGTIGGLSFGVAKRVNILAVKVMNAQGVGSVSDTLEGFAFAVQSALASKRPSVINVSLGGEGNSAWDVAAAAAVNAGIHVVVAAGNSGEDAANFSPARANGVITVGAVDINNNMGSFSNFGADVDIFAPGVSILSSSKDSDTATAVLTGTSMACPHVAGLVALYLSLDATTTVQQMPQLLQKRSFQGLIKNLPSTRSPNKILFNPLVIIKT